jgi:tetratricopeptide (TPR) repeat protein
MKGGEVHPLDGGGAEQALARHLAIRHPKPVWGSELETALSRHRDQPIPRTSLHVAANKLRRLLREVAGGDEEASELARNVMPRASGLGSGPDRPDDPAYCFSDGLVWVDLLDAPDAFALAPPYLHEDEGTSLGGGAAAQGFAGFAQLREEVEERVQAARAAPSIKLAKHLEEFTPPIASLAALVPVALDRLRPGAKVVVEGPGDSGRLHLAEAIELAARAWCGRGTLQIRERTKPRAQDLLLPGHVYVVDLTREPTQNQEKTLREIGVEAGAVDRWARPAMLLVIEEGAGLPGDLGLEPWEETPPIRLGRAGAEEAAEAYLIATNGVPRGVAERRADFKRLADDYARDHGVAIGLRAASAAATFSAEAGGQPPASTRLPAPGAQDLPLGKLKGEDRELARVLAWFSNSMFTLDDARVAAGTETELSLDRVLALATRIPGGGSGAFELRPALIGARPAAQVAGRICDHLLQEGDPGAEAIERWPERAVSILEDDRIERSKRLELVPLLIQPCRARGPVEQLARAIGRLLMHRQNSMKMEPAAVKGAIERAHLLADLGRMGDAQLVLWHVARQRESKSRRPLKIEARLRLAKVTAQLGDADKAQEHAAEALRLSGGELEGPVERFFGWEAIFDSRFEAALQRFGGPAALGGSDDERADAILGATQALLRLGRLKEAEAHLPKLERLALRRSTRDRVSRVKARARLLRGEVKAGIEIINEALPRGGYGIGFESAHLLEARSYLRALDGEPAEALRDLERCEALVKHARNWKRALRLYIRAVIHEKQALRAKPKEELASTYRGKARERAHESLVEAGDNPWHRARAHTLLARVDLEEGDHNSLAWNLRWACGAHRDLEVVCPDVLAETVHVALLAADLWQMPVMSEKLDSLGACLVPRDQPLRIDLGSSLDLIEEVAAEIVGREPPEPGTKEREPNLWVLGRVGHVIWQGGEEVLSGGGAPLFRVVNPREMGDLDKGVYEFEPSKARLRSMRSPKLQALVRGTANRRFATQRLGAILVIGGAPSHSESMPDPYLPRWAEVFRAKALEAGIAVIERYPLELGALEDLGLDPSNGFLSLGLAELPVL